MPSQEVTVIVGVAVLVLAISANYHHYSSEAVAISPGAFKKGDPNKRCGAGKGAACIPEPTNPWERGCQPYEHCRGSPPAKEAGDGQPTAESPPQLPDHGAHIEDEGGNNDDDDDDDDIDEDVDDRKDVKESAE